jgi:hypothetical protein
MYGRILKESSSSPYRSIYGLIDQDQIPRFHGLIQAANRTRGNNPPASHRLKGVDIGPIWHLRWIQQVADAMAGENGNRHPIPITKYRRSGWTAKRCFYFHCLAMVGLSQQLFQTRTTYDSDPIFHLEVFSRTITSTGSISYCRDDHTPIGKSLLTTAIPAANTNHASVLPSSSPAILAGRKLLSLCQST